MRNPSLRWSATSVAVVTAVALFLDSLLPWQRAEAQVAGAVEVRSTTSGILTGWGTLAAFSALLLAVIGLRRLRHRAPGPPLGMMLLALGMLVTPVLAVFVTRADVDVAQTAVSVTVDTTLWAAWTGLGLAVISAAATLLPFMPQARQHGARRRAAAHHRVMTGPVR